MKTIEDYKISKKLALLEISSLPMDLQGAAVIEFKQQIDDIFYLVSGCSDAKLGDYHHILRLNQVLMDLIVENFIEVETPSSE